LISWPAHPDYLFWSLPTANLRLIDSLVLYTALEVVACLAVLTLILSVLSG
jgi:hypothetical protein